MLHKNYGDLLKKIPKTKPNPSSTFACSIVQTPVHNKQLNITTVLFFSVKAKWIKQYSQKCFYVRMYMYRILQERKQENVFKYKSKSSM